MSKKPYPGIPPNYRTVADIGGYTRTCFVLEFRSLGALESTQIAMIEEQIGAVADKLGNSIAIVQNTDFVTPDRFDPVLCDGLRLPAQKNK